MLILSDEVDCQEYNITNVDHACHSVTITALVDPDGSRAFSFSWFVKPNNTDVSLLVFLFDGEI